MTTFSEDPASAVTAVLPGAEAWTGGDGETGVLLLHGLSGNPVSLRPLAERLVEGGLAVELPLLPGHGTHWRELAATNWRDWARVAIAAFDDLRARTRQQIVFGLSMGGALALHLAQTRGDEIAGLVLVNPWLRARDPRLPLLPLLKLVLPTISGTGNDIAKPGADERAYDRIPVRAVASAIELQRMVRGRLHLVNQPTIVFTSRTDNIVHPRDRAIVAEGVASAELERVWLEQSRHVATLDHDADVIAERTLAFARRVAATGRGPEPLADVP